MRDKVVTQLLEEGLSVMDGVVQITPRVSGVWENEGAEYDEKIHKRTVDIVPTADLRDVLDAISVKVLGAKEATARITSITDTATGLKDGTITIGDDIIIEGEKLKIDEKDSSQGVFFIRSDNVEFKTTRRLSINKPSQIIARVPKNIGTGAVTVLVRTKYAGSGKALKEVRDIVFGYPCIAKT